MNNLIVPKSIDTILENVLGPTSKTIGQDLQTLYKKGRELILRKSFQKLKNPNDGKKANLRVTRDVFWNGSFTDEAICAEYFGGILASSRSADGKDDRGVYYTDIIKSLSSQQLLLHYIIYHSLNKLLLEMPSDKKRPNVGDANELSQYRVWFATKELEETEVISLEKDLIALNSKSLVEDFEGKDHQLENGQRIPYTRVQPTMLGVQLYAVAHNKLADWRKLPLEDFGEFPDIKAPTYFTFSIEELLIKAGLKKNEKS